MIRYTFQNRSCILKRKIKELNKNKFDVKKEQEWKMNGSWSSLTLWWIMIDNEAHSDS